MPTIDQAALVDLEADDALAAITAAHEAWEKARAAETAAKTRFAALLAAARDHPDSDVSPAAVARTLGWNKAYAYQLVKWHERHGDG